MKIGPHDLDEKCLVVAEIGANHEGDFEKARTLLRMAADAGADAVKFQAYYPKELRFVSPQADPERFQRSSLRALSWTQFHELAAEARRVGVTYLNTCFDLETVKALDGDLCAFKIASGDLTNVPLLRAVRDTGKPVVLSTGMGTEEEVAAALRVLAGGKGIESLRERVALLQCTSGYPTPPDQVHLRVMQGYARRFGLRVGYSDHTFGMLASQTAVAMGACIIEKHFTDVKEGREFRDHQLSADPADMKLLVKSIREIEAMKGREQKSPQPVEAPNLTPMRRSMGVSTALEAGTVLTADVLVALRPATGWPASRPDELVGKRLKRRLDAGELVRAEDVA